MQGIYILEQKIIDTFAHYNERIDMPELFLKAKGNNSNVNVCPIFEYWIDIGRLDSLKKAQNQGMMI